MPTSHMPFKKSYKKRSTKRRYTRRVKRGGRRYSRRSIMPFQPASRIVKLNYFDQLNLSPNSGSVQQCTFRANSIYDPNSTGTGHQPLFHDQLQELYNNYVVLGSKITATFWSEDVSTAYGAYACIKVTDDFNISSSALPYAELEGGKLVKWKMFRANASASNSMLTLTQTYSTKRFFGVKDVKDSKDSFGAPLGNNPTNGAFFNIWVQHPDMSTTLPTIHCAVKITFIAQVSEPKDAMYS